MPNKKKRIPFATGGWVNTQSGGDRPLSGETVLTREMQEALAAVMKPATVPDVLIPKQHTVQFTIPKPDTLPKVSIDPSLLEQHPRMFERSRQTGSGVSLRAKTTTDYTDLHGFILF
jgi:hypothetical protein